MGESRSVIRQTQDTRCYVNIPTTQRSSTLPLCCAALRCSGSLHESQGNIWFSMLEGTLSVWHAVRVWSVSIWTRRPTAALTSLLPLATPPLRLQRLHNALWQSWLLLALRKHCGYTDKAFAQLWREKKVTTTFGTAVTRICQEYRKMQTERSCLL